MILELNHRQSPSSPNISTAKKPQNQNPIKKRTERKKVSPSLPPDLAPNPIVLLKPLPIQHPLLGTPDPARADLVDIQTHDAIFGAGVLLHVDRDGAVGRRLPDEPADALHFQHGVRRVREFGVEGVGAAEVVDCYGGWGGHCCGILLLVLLRCWVCDVVVGVAGLVARVRFIQAYGKGCVSSCSFLPEVEQINGAGSECNFWSFVSRPGYLNTYADMNTRTKLGKGKLKHDTKGSEMQDRG
jgi:hypothetical protein